MPFRNAITTIKSRTFSALQIKSLNASCGTLKRDCMRAQDLANSESEMRRRLEDQLVTCKKESGALCGRSFLHAGYFHRLREFARHFLLNP